MSKRPQGPNEDFRAIINALAESVADMSDEEILQEAKEAGLDVKQEAESVRTIFSAALKSERQKKLNEAEASYKRSIEAMKKKTYVLPTSTSERRTLLQGIFTRRPELQGLLTAQHREFKDLPDQDVEELLRQLLELGLLDEK